MEELLRGLSGLIRVFGNLVVGLARIVQGLAAAADLQIDDPTAIALSLLIILMFIAFGVRIVLFPGKGMAMFKPQTIVLYTNKTPFQIVAEDIGGCLSRILVLVLLILVVVFLIELTHS